MADFALLDVNDNPLTFGDFEEVPPGESYSALTGGPLALKIKNVTGVAKTNRKLVVEARPPYAINSYVRLSLDGVAFSPGPLELGAFATGEAKTVYLDIEMPAGADGGPNQRCTLRVLPSNG